MKQNKKSPTARTSDTSVIVDVPIWTIPNVPVSCSENDIDPPKYIELNNFPPNYFDISIIPKNAILFHNEVVPYVEASQAKIERKTEGIFSFDPLIDTNPDQLWLYFMTYLNEKPCLHINIHGYHIEYYTTYENARRPNGDIYIRSVLRTRNVTDFSYCIDLAPYISQEWWRVAVVSSKEKINNDEIVSFRDALEQYTRSGKSIKEIVCKKQLIGWNFEELKSKIKALISSTGYDNNISIDYSLDNHRICARSSSKLSRFSYSIWTRILCFLTCLCLIFAPIYLYLRTVGSIRNRIVADYNMISSADIFLRTNAGVIVNAVLNHSKKRHVAIVT